MALIAAIAEGYPCPKNLDRRLLKLHGPCPSTEQDTLLQIPREKR